MSKQVQITKEGLETLKNEHNDLVEKKRPKVVDRLAYARTQGDLSENSDYINAKEELEFLDGRIEELEHVIQHAKVVGKRNGSKVSLGTRVTLRSNGSKNEFNIVGEWEADPLNKKISHTSPLGRALLGKKKGEKVEVQAPAGKVTYEILSVN